MLPQARPLAFLGSSPCLPRLLEVLLSIPCCLEVRFSGRKGAQAYTHIGHRVALKDGQSAAWLALPATIAHKAAFNPPPSLTRPHATRQRRHAVRPGNSGTTRPPPEWDRCATLTYSTRLLRHSAAAAAPSAGRWEGETTPPLGLRLLSDPDAASGAAGAPPRAARDARRRQGCARSCTAVPPHTAGRATRGLLGERCERGPGPGGRGRRTHQPHTLPQPAAPPPPSTGCQCAGSTGEERWAEREERPLPPECRSLLWCGLGPARESVLTSMSTSNARSSEGKHLWVLQKAPGYLCSAWFPDVGDVFSH